MKKKYLLSILLFATLLCSCNENTDDSDEIVPTPRVPLLLEDFWFGYYQEDPTTNPEDPTPGFLYLQIPESGFFNGELYFSYSGCVPGVDVGRASGTALNDILDGTWQGNADGRAIGGSYDAQFTDDTYIGTFTNTSGKLEIECSDDFSYFVAPNGTFFLQRIGVNDALNVVIDTSVNPPAFSWTAPASGLFYNVVIIDAECLDSELDLEECLMWNGVTNTSAIIYGEGLVTLDQVPVRDLVVGNSYLAVVTCINDEGIATASSNVGFVYQP